MGHEELQPEQVDLSISPLYAAVLRTLNAFCATCSIHGLKYTRDNDTNRTVRFVWILISVVMFICAIMMVHTFYMDYRSNPTRLNIDSDSAPVTSIYFPAVTICPEVLFNHQRALQFTSQLKYPASIKAIDVLQRLHIFRGFSNDDQQYAQTDIDLMENVLQYNNLSVEEFASQMHWTCDDLLFRCRYMSAIEDCAELFQVSKTYTGYCCSFNLQQPGINFTAKYAAGGLSLGLSVILRYDDDNFKAHTPYSHGFKLFVEGTGAYPSAHAVSKYLHINSELFISVRAEEVFCSDAVKSLSANQRQCVFPYEYPLNFFDTYVYPHCELNCRLTKMIKFCGCYTYVFNFNRTNDKICTFKDIPCLLGNFSKIIGRYRFAQCTCLNNCEYVEYNVQTSAADLQFKTRTIDPFYNGMQHNDAVVHIFMNSQFYRRVRHDLLSNMVTLVSNLGSAFSLFVGMSMISVIEIIYYFTVILRKQYRQELNARAKLLFRKSNPAVSNDL